MGPLEFLTTARSGESPDAEESAFATAVSTGLAGLEQPARNAPADAASIVRPKLRLVNLVGAWFSEFEFDVLQDVHPLETHLTQSVSFFSDNSIFFSIV